MNMDRVEENYSTELCKLHTDLSAMQINYLRRISPVLDFVADLAHGQIMLFARGKLEDEYVVVNIFEPTTTFNPKDSSLLGCRFNSKIVDIVDRTFIEKRQQQCMDSTLLVKLMDVYTFPLIEDGIVVAVAALGVLKEDAKINGFMRLLNTGGILLENADRALPYCLNRKLKPSDGIVISDKNERIIFVNNVASSIYHLLGINNLAGMYLNNRLFNAYIKKESLDPNNRYVKEITTDNMVLIRQEWPVYEAGTLLTKIIIVSDITEIRKKDKELLVKSAVIQEIHHRMKNNLQTIASVLRLQARRAKCEEVKLALTESVNRILSISVVHEFLSKEGTEQTEVGTVLKNVLDNVCDNMVSRDFDLTREFASDKLKLQAKYVSNLALVVNELTLNSIEHGFREKAHGKISLHIKIEDENCVVEFEDDGCGFPKDLDYHRTKSLGLQIIRTLVEDDLEGTIEFTNRIGAYVRLAVPIRKLEGEING